MTEGLSPAEEDPGMLSPGADVVGSVFWCDAYIGALWSPASSLRAECLFQTSNLAWGSVYNRCSINDTNNSTTTKKDLQLKDVPESKQRLPCPAHVTLPCPLQCMSPHF